MNGRAVVSNSRYGTRAACTKRKSHHGTTRTTRIYKIKMVILNFFGPCKSVVRFGLLRGRAGLFSWHKQQGLSRRATNPLRERLKILSIWLSYLHMRAPVFLLDHVHLVF